jgi:hypothetical protein
MKIERLILREIRMRLKAPFETNFMVVQDRLDMSGSGYWAIKRLCAKGHSRSSH